MSEDLPKLPPRPAHGHKGTFGTIAIIGGCCTGSRHMIGAPALAALGALRAGAGLARLVMPAPILSAGVTLAPSATGVALSVHPLTQELDTPAAVAEVDRQASTAACLAIGPGLGLGEAPRAMVLRAVQQEDTPVVVDADGLNALAEIPELWRDFRARAVLTPHPGEFRRLGAAFKISHDPTREDTRLSGAAALAQRLGAVVVLKGSGTVVSDGQRTWRCGRGHACLATAGTGDVLTGVIAGLIAQHADVLSPYDAARLAVEAHARAGEAWARSHQASAGLLAEELAGLLPASLEALR